MPVDVVGGESGLGLGDVLDLTSFLSSTQQYGPVLQQLMAAQGYRLPTPLRSVTPEELIKIARSATADGASEILRRHEQREAAKISQAADSLRRAGVPKLEVEKRVRAAKDGLLSTQTKRAVEEQRRAGAVSRETRSKLDAAKRRYPAVDAAIRKVVASAPVQSSAAALKKTGSEALKKIVPGFKVPAGAAGAAAAVDLVFGGKRLTAERASKAVLSTAKGAAEDFVRSKTGIPIRIPKKLTVGEISKSLSGLIPRNLSEAIDTGIAVGTQYAASAVSSLVAGSAVGSVIPGVGTVVGIGVALAINAFKDDFKKLFGEDLKPHERKCPTKVKCPKAPEGLSPVELLPWVAEARARVKMTVAQDQRREYCGKGSGPECDARLYWLENEALRFVLPGKRRFEDSTLSVIGLPLTEKLIKLYSSAPKSYAHYVRRPGARGYRTIILEPNSVSLVLTMLERRKKDLDDLVSRGRSVSGSSNLPKYRWDLSTELKNAMVQYSLDQGESSKRWLETVIRMWEKMVSAERSSQTQRSAEFERMKKLSSDPEIARRLRESTRFLT